jgi:hypothetical protein
MAGIRILNFPALLPNGKNYSFNFFVKANVGTRRAAGAARFSVPPGRPTRQTVTHTNG